jgi:hypothetical protein
MYNKIEYYMIYDINILNKLYIFFPLLAVDTELETLNEPTPRAIGDGAIGRVLQCDAEINSVNDYIDE